MDEALQRLHDEREIEASVKQIIQAEPSPYDSHPAPADRFALARALAASAPTAASDDGDEAWCLFTGRDELQRHMTGVVRSNIAQQHGIVIPGSDAPTAATVAPAP